MRLIAFAMKQASAEFGLQRLNGARQRRLRNVAAFCCAREIQLASQREKVSNLLHFHGLYPSMAGQRPGSRPMLSFSDIGVFAGARAKVIAIYARA
jgi:hypothetical protein